MNKKMILYFISEHEKDEQSLLFISKTDSGINPHITHHFINNRILCIGDKYILDST